jgi:uncharacterized protein with ParB-like and HNH nuclease domain
MKDDEIEFQKLASEESDLDVSTAPYSIKTYGADLTVEILSQKVENGEILIPSFQRKYVWPIKKASKLIESCLLGLPVPQIFLYREEENQNLLVVDGQQRLKTLNYFINGIFNEKEVFSLHGVKDVWEKKTYKTLSVSDKRRFNNFILRATIFEQTDPKDNSSVFEIFERLNTGGMSLTQQEIRNCVINGNITTYLDTLNNYSNWRLLLGKKYPDARMKDIEMIIRFFALVENWNGYKNPMKDYISDYMRRNRNLEKPQMVKMERIFKSVVDKIYAAGGVDSFKLKAGINIAVFDSITTATAILGPNKISSMKIKIEKLKNNKKYLETVLQGTTNEDKVKKRINLAIHAFK